ncbi:hypothetical protein GCM10018954_075560 [Kutzneria kofuensis]
MLAVMALPAKVRARLCQRLVPSAATVPWARVETLALVLELRMDQAPVSLTRRW